MTPREIAETSFRLYRRMADRDAFGRVLIDFLSGRFKKEVQ
jgi:hypothetical protein